MDTTFNDISVVKGCDIKGDKSARQVKNAEKSSTSCSKKEKVVVENTDEFGEILSIDTDILKNRSGYRFIKRVSDVTLSIFALTVLSLLMAGVAAAIYIDDPHAGPIFVQERVGKNGRRFKIYKFRSMVYNAEELKKELEAKGYTMKEPGDPTYKLENDPRITRVGRFIRKTSIDELPQLLNIIKGDMSIVGPRPLITSEVEQFDDFSMQRHLVRPGLTCYWQSTKDRDKVPFSDWMKMDVRYIHNCSVWEDIKIILKTVRIVLTANGN